MGDIEELKNNSKTLDFHTHAAGSDCYFCNQNKKSTIDESVLEKLKVSEVCYVTLFWECVLGVN